MRSSAVTLPVSLEPARPSAEAPRLSFRGRPAAAETTAKERERERERRGG